MKINDDFAKLRELLHNKEFQEFVRTFREDNAPYSAGGWAEVIVGAFTLRSWLTPVVAHYLESNEFDESRAASPVTIEYEEYPATIKLILASDITQPALKEWIDINWSKQMKPHLDVLPEQRQVVPNIRRENAIYDDYLNRKKLSLTVTGVAVKHGVHSSTVYKIAARRKKDFK